jgi:hypothetical protein
MSFSLWLLVELKWVFNSRRIFGRFALWLSLGMVLIVILFALWLLSGMVLIVVFAKIDNIKMIGFVFELLFVAFKLV